MNLRNIHFVGSDVRDIDPTESGLFDYIIAHGLYSGPAVIGNPHMSEKYRLELQPPPMLIADSRSR